MYSIQVSVTMTSAAGYPRVKAVTVIYLNRLCELNLAIGGNLNASEV